MPVLLKVDRATLGRNLRNREAVAGSLLMLAFAAERTGLSPV
jgi:hypothetical protein